MSGERISAYRVSGAVVAVAAALLLIWVAMLSLGPEPTVEPTATVAAEQGEPDARAVLQARTELQGWRAQSGPAPQAAAPAADARGAGRLRFERRDALANGEALVETWRADPPQAAALPARGFIEGSSSLPYAQAEVYEQPQGRDWRRRHGGEIRYGGGWLLLGVILVLAMFLAFRGRIRLSEGFSGERIERFNSIERANHWMTAVSFMLMGLTGLILLYGKPLLLPLIGHDAMGATASWSAWLHMAFAVPFVLGVLIMIGLWIRGNLPDRYDWRWLRRFGDFLRDDGEHPPAGRFNAGQQLVFWAVTLGGLGLLASGLTLMFPFFWFGYDGMQWAQLAHSALGLILIAVIFGHIYIGSVGMEDAFAAMWSGRVDRNWLKEHHRAWYDRFVRRRGADSRGGASSAESASVPGE